MNTVQLEASSYGLNYKTVPSRFNRITVEAQFENFFDQLSDLVPTSTDNLNWFRNKLVDIANDVILTPVWGRCVLTKHWRISNRGAYWYSGLIKDLARQIRAKHVDHLIGYKQIPKAIQARRNRPNRRAHQKTPWSTVTSGIFERKYTLCFETLGKLSSIYVRASHKRA